MATFSRSNEIARRVSLPGTAALCALLVVAGCKSAAPAADDNMLANSIQGQLNADTAITGQSIRTSVSKGVATLTGTVANDAQRTLAARDASTVPGIREVVNSINVVAGPPASAQAVAPMPAPIPVPIVRSGALVKPSPAEPRRPETARNPAPIERRPLSPNGDRQANQPGNYTPPPAPPAYTPAPVAPPQPVYRSVTVAAGNSVPVRITQTLDSASTPTDSSFSGVVASDIIVDGLVAIPAGSGVSGHVDDVRDAARFKGSSSITVSLATITRRGERIGVSSDPYTVQGKGRGANTAEKAGGGAAVGAILGGIFGGGKGAAIGAAAGAGAGAGSNAITRGQQVQIASESVVRFRLASPITVRVRTDVAEPQPQQRRYEDPTLQPRPNP